MNVRFSSNVSHITFRTFFFRNLFHYKQKQAFVQELRFLVKPLLKLILCPFTVQGNFEICLHIAYNCCD